MSSGPVEVATYDLGDRGAPRSLTYLHGYPSSSLDIAPVTVLLREAWRVVTLDMPGFGASEKPRGHPYSINAAADTVEQMWSMRGIDATLLVAHDYSVSVAQELLARRDEGALAVELSGVVWMNGGLYPDLHRPTLGQQLLADPLSGADVAAAITEDTFVVGIGGTWGQRVPPNDAEIHEMFLGMDERGGIRIMNELLHYLADRRAFQARWSRSLETCDLPSTFVWGDLDPVSGAHMIVRVEERIPEARVVRLDDVGHWPPLEAPDAVAAEIDAMASSR